MESAWKNMKSAPKDGTSILIKIRKDEYAVASWQDFDTYSVGWYIGVNSWGEDMFIKRPVGWLEIPK